MEREGYKYFQSGLQYLEDIQKLSEQNLSPLIRQALYNFTRAQDAHSKNLQTLALFPKLQQFAHSYLDRYRQKIMIRESIEELSLSFVTEEIKLATFDQLLEAMPLFSEAIKLLPFIGKTELKITNQELSFIGKVQLSEELENKRVQAYTLTRKALAGGLLMTFCHGKLTDGVADLTLKLRLPDDTGRVYLLDLESENLPYLGFSPVLADYQIHPNDLARVGRHLCIEVTKDLSVEKYFRPSKRVLDPDSQLEILHFAFLFRPVSLIIPKRCRLTARAEIDIMLGGTESGAAKYSYLDIISLMAY